MLLYNIAWVINMAGSEEVRYMMRKANVNSSQLAELLHISRQGVHNKLIRNTFSYEELIPIADLL